MFSAVRSRTRSRIRLCALCGTFAALLAVCAWISVPTSPPFTLQTFAVFAAALLLGRRAGTASVLAYLVLGALGAPVFSGFGGGIGVLVGPTGGYLIGFLFAAWIAGALAEGDAPLGRRILGCALGLAACYAFGTAWFVAVSLRAGREMSVGSALGLCVAPFLIPDAAKIALAQLGR